MSFGAYFRVALFVPLIVGCICFALTSGGPDRLVKIWLVEFIGGATFFAGIPYFIYALFVYAWSWERPDSVVKVGYWLVPLGYTLFMIPLPWLLFPQTTWGATEMLFTIAILCGCALVVGYGYALVIYAGWLVLSRIFPLREESVAPVPGASD